MKLKRSIIAEFLFCFFIFILVVGCKGEQMEENMQSKALKKITPEAWEELSKKNI